MAPNKCDVCGKEFYSDTEFQEHKFIEGVQQQAENNGRLFLAIASDLLSINILLVQQRDRCDIETAVRTWFKESQSLGKLWNQLRQAQMDG